MTQLTGPHIHPFVHPTVNPDTQPHSDSQGDAGVDAEELAAALRNRIRGEVRFDVGSRALYATDGSNYRQVPIGVVIPRDVDDAVETMRLCREFGRRSSAAAAGRALRPMLQCGRDSGFFQVYGSRSELDTLARRARVEPGVVLDTLRNAAEKHHLTFAPDPSTHTHCTLGGMIGNNSCGVHSVHGRQDRRQCRGP